MLKSTLAAAAFVAACAAGATSVAQPTAEADPIEFCRETSDGKKDRIRCLEAAITRLMGGADTLAAAPAAPTETEDAASIDVAATPADPDAPTGLGAEQLVDRKERFEKPRKRETSKVVEYAYTNTDRLIVFLDNGQVWRQTRKDGEKVRISKKQELEVTIKEGFISGYRMNFKDTNKAIRVERIK